MDRIAMLQRTLDGANAMVREVPADALTRPTPCAEWDVRTVLNHLVGENWWVPELAQGKTIDEVGDQFEGDLLGTDPVRTWDEAADTAVAAVSEPGALERTVHLSFGDTPGEEYAMQLFADHVIHGWDLARAIGADETMPPALLDPLASWYADREQMYRDGGAVGPRVDVPADADPQTRLLAAFGRTR